MRILMLLAALVTATAAVLPLVLLRADWPFYLALGLAWLSGGVLFTTGMATVHAAGAAALKRDGWRGWLPPVRDYLSLRRMAHDLVGRAGSTAIASAEVSHHADRMDQRLARQESVVRDASSSMNAITSAIEQVASGTAELASVASRSRASSHARPVARASRPAGRVDPGGAVRAHLRPHGRHPAAQVPYRFRRLHRRAPAGHPGTSAGAAWTGLRHRL